MKNLLIFFISLSAVNAELLLMSKLSFSSKVTADAGGFSDLDSDNGTYSEAIYSFSLKSSQKDVIGYAWGEGLISSPAGWSVVYVEAMDSGTVVVYLYNKSSSSLVELSDQFLVDAAGFNPFSSSSAYNGMTSLTHVEVFDTSTNVTLKAKSKSNTTGLVTYNEASGVHGCFFNKTKSAAKYSKYLKANYSGDDLFYSGGYYNSSADSGTIFVYTPLTAFSAELQAEISGVIYGGLLIESKIKISAPKIVDLTLPTEE